MMKTLTKLDARGNRFHNIFIKGAILLVIFLYAPNVYGAKGFVVIEGGNSQILIADEYSEYIIEHDYNCYDSEFYDGATIYIDSYISPMYGDTIIIPGSFSDSTCSVTSSDEVNIKKYYVDEVFDSEDKIIVTDKSGTQYLVEYGLGCGLSFWRYEGKTIDIDIGGAFLDGIGDQIYLFNSDDDCKVWDAEEFGENASSSGTYYPTASQYICPANSHTSSSDSTKCDCDSGYQINSSKDACVLIPKKTNDQLCQDDFGVNSKWVGTSNSDGTVNCNCKDGYVWDTTGKSCVVFNPPVAQSNPKVENNTSVVTEIKKNPVINKEKEKTSEDLNKLDVQSPIVSEPELQDIAEESSNQKVPWYKRLFNWLFH